MEIKYALERIKQGDRGFGIFLRSDGSYDTIAKEYIDKLEDRGYIVRREEKGGSTRVHLTRMGKRHLGMIK